MLAAGATSLPSRRSCTPSRRRAHPAGRRKEAAAFVPAGDDRIAATSVETCSQLSISNPCEAKDYARTSHRWAWLTVASGQIEWVNKAWTYRSRPHGRRGRGFLELWLMDTSYPYPSIYL